VACATSDEVIANEMPAPEEAGVLPPTPPDASDAAVDATDAVVVRCSPDGWCSTSLPDTDLSMKDIWPVSADRAFAIAESVTVGVKVLEWRAEDGAWKYIDDNSQNQLDGAFAGSIWAPDADTVYYAVSSYIYRGTRLAPPASGWSWSRQKLEDNSHVGDPTHATHDHGRTSSNDPLVGVWGLDADDVYAWYSNTIFHWKSENGAAASWVAEYVADDPDEDTQHLFFVSAAGSGPNDIWFAGARKGIWEVSDSIYDCAIIVRKTATGFARVADGTPVSANCSERTGFPLVGGSAGWLTSIQSTSPGTVTGIKTTGFPASTEVLQLSSEIATLREDPVPALERAPGSLFSYWRSPDHEWLTGWGFVLRGEEAGDGMTYSNSSLVLDGNPTRAAMHRIRGTAETNIWAIGDGYAFHKTTL